MRVVIGKEANEFLEKNGMHVASYEVAKTLEEGERKSKRVSFPLVLKLISKDAVHKTEVGGIKVVRREEEFQDSFESLLEIAKKRKIKVEEILLQKFVGGVELIVGLKKDPTFGHVIMLGLGGIYVEVLKDVSFRVCPINDKDATEMINDLKAKDVILSERKKLDVDKLKKILVRISKIPQKKKDLSELDINPLMLNEEEAKAVDVRVIFE